LTRPSPRPCASGAFGETRRVKVIGRLPGETSCLTLVWAVLDRASGGSRGLTMIAEGLRLLQNLGRSLLDPPRQLRPRTVTETRNADRPENVNSLCPYRVSWPNLKISGHIRERVARDSRARAVSAPRPPESATSAVASRPPLP